MTNLYNLRLLAPNHFAMGKFDADLNFEAMYELKPKGSGFTCTCPAGQRSVKLKPCKHQRMIRVMMGAVNTNRFYEPESGNWAAPLAQEDAVKDNGDLTATEVAELEREALANGPDAAKVFEPQIDAVMHHLTEMAAAAKIQEEGLTAEEAVYGFSEPPKGHLGVSSPTVQAEAVVQPTQPPPTSRPIVTRRI